MIVSVFRKLAPVCLALALFGLWGCGNKNRTTVTGKVTYEGQPVESGFVSFYPEDGQGGTGGGSIVDGEYRAADISVGKNRVHITITEPPTGEVVTGKSRAEANAERLAKIKTAKKKRAPVPKDAAGNDKVVDIVPGSQSVDMDLKKPAGK
jgi:hypothetical protein